MLDGRRLGELARHTAVYGLGPVLGQAAAFVLLPLYTNLLSPSDYGRLEVIVLASTFLNVFLGLQTVTQIQRMYHAAQDTDEQRRVVSTAVIFTGVLTAAAMLPVDLFRHRLSHAIFGTDAYGDLLRLGVWSVVSTNVFASALAYLQARKMSRAVTTLAVCQLVATLSLNLVLVAWLGRGVEGILTSQLVVGGAFALGTMAWVLTRTGVAVSPVYVRQIVAFGLPLIGWSLAVFVMNAADRLVLSAVGSLTDVGVYSLANRFGASLLIFVVTPFSNFWGAERFNVARQPNGRDVIARIFTYFFVVLCFAALAISVVGHEVVRLMASEQFWGAARILPVLVLAYVFWGAFDAFMTGVLIEGGTRAVGAMTALGAAVNVVLCAGLGHALLAVGVAWAKVITLAILAAGVYAISQRRYPIRYELGRVGKVLAVSVSLFLTSLLLDGLPPLLGIVANAPLVLAFPLALAAVGFFEPAEKRWLLDRARAVRGRLQAATSA